MLDSDPGAVAINVQEKMANNDAGEVTKMCRGKLNVFS